MATKHASTSTLLRTPATTKAAQAAQCNAKVVEVEKGDRELLTKEVQELSKLGAVVATNQTWASFCLKNIQHKSNLEALVPKNDPQYEDKWRQALEYHTQNYILPGKASSYVGMDPECFILDGNSMVIEPWTLGYSLDKRVKGNYADGFACEMRPEASYCAAYFMDNLQASINEIHSRINSSPGLRMAPECDYADVQKQLDTAPAEAKVLGCSKSYNAYNNAPKLPMGETLTIRTAGAHIHIGESYIKHISNKEDVNPKVWARHLVRTMDLCCGMVLTLVFKGFENPLRRKYYGRAGEYRLPSHGGIEYRVPGPMTICHPGITHLAIELARRSWGFASICPDWYEKVDYRDVQRVINEHDFELGLKIFNEHNWIWKVLALPGSREGFKQIVQQGLKSINLINPLDMAINWSVYPNPKGWTTHSKDGRDLCYWETFNKAIRG